MKKYYRDERLEKQEEYKQKEKQLCKQFESRKKSLIEKQYN